MYLVSSNYAYQWFRTLFKEAKRYSIVDIHFSSCGFLVFGLTEIGSLFCSSVIGSLFPLLSPSNGYSNGEPVYFLPISPLITLDNAPLQVFDEIFLLINLLN